MWEKECKFKDAQCYECKVKGHTAPICPKKNRVHPVQEEQEEEFLFKMTSDKDSARREIFVNPFPNDKFNSSKLKEFPDDNFKFDEYGGMFSKRVENTVRKGEIAHYEQFLLFPQCFKKTSTGARKKQGLFGKGLIHL